MRHLSRLTAVFIILLSISSNLFSARLVLQKKDGNNDQCYPQSCIMQSSGHISGSPTFWVLLDLTINIEATSETCSFPWTIRAFDSDNRQIGISSYIEEKDFYPVHNSTQLGVASVNLSILEKNLMLTPSLGCFETTCDQLYSVHDFRFEIYSANEDPVAPSCLAFQHSELIPESEILQHEVALCRYCDADDAPPTVILDNRARLEHGNSENGQYAATYKESLIPINEFSKPVEKPSIYPNPAATTLNVSLPQRVKSTNEITLSIHMSSGKCIKRISSIGTENIELNVGNFANGVYWLVIEEVGSSPTVQKFSILH